MGKETVYRFYLKSSMDWIKLGMPQLITRKKIGVNPFFTATDILFDLEEEIGKNDYEIYGVVDLLEENNGKNI